MAKNYSRFTKDKPKGIRAYHYRKSSLHKEKQQEGKKGMMDLQNSQKIVRWH